MRTSNQRQVSGEWLRALGWGLAQILIGVVVAGIVVLLPPFRVDLCDPDWRAGPIALLVIAGLLIIPAAAFARTRLLLGAFVLVVAGWAAWILYFGNALGCD